jgi:hypothetical protein
MKSFTVPSMTTALCLLASLVTAAPTSSCKTTTNSSPFYLVTTSSCECSSNSTLLPSVSATSLFDPQHQANYLLRLISPEYFSLPNFTITDGVLHTISSGPFGLETYLYNSTPPVAGTELQFAQSLQGNGGLSLIGGYLLAVNGSGKGWTICSGPLGERVVCIFRGNKSSSLTDKY